MGRCGRRSCVAARCPPSQRSPSPETPGPRPNRPPLTGIGREGREGVGRHGGAAGLLQAKVDGLGGGGGGGQQQQGRGGEGEGLQGQHVFVVEGGGRLERCALVTVLRGMTGRRCGRLFVAWGRPEGCEASAGRATKAAGPLDALPGAPVARNGPEGSGKAGGEAARGGGGPWTAAGGRRRRRRHRGITSRTADVLRRALAGCHRTCKLDRGKHAGKNRAWRDK